MSPKLLLLLCLLLLGLSSTAQRVAPPGHIAALPEQAERLLGNIRVWQDSLAALRSSAPDSAELRAALDSLRQRELNPEALEEKADSLSQAFSSSVSERLGETEARLRRQIEEARAQLAERLLPEEARQALASLEEAGSADATRLASEKLKDALPDLSQLPVPADAAALPDAQALQAQAKERALRKAGEAMAAPLDRLGEARADFDRYKNKASSVPSMKDMPRGLLGPNPLRGRPWRERLVLGTLWQAGRQGGLFVDLGPYAAWRLTERLSAGAGLQYRLALPAGEGPRADRVGGLYAFADYEVKNGFFGRLHLEELSARVPRADAPAGAETLGREWVRGLSVGAGRNYSLYKAVRGFTSVHYNILHERGRTPYLHPLQVKVGFYLTVKDLRGKR